MLGKRSRPSAARFFARWETEVMRLHEELESGAYQPGAYTNFIITVAGGIWGCST